MSSRAVYPILCMKTSEILSFSLTLGLQREFEGPGLLTHRTQPHSLALLPTLFLGCVSQLASCEQKTSTEQKASPSICFLGIYL